MESLTRDLVFLTLQFLEKEKFKESQHKLDQESGIFFNINHFEEKILAGEWYEVEKYLSGFTKIQDNEYSTKIFYEAGQSKAVEILVKDWKVLSAFDQELLKEIIMLLTLEDFRKHKLLSGYGDTKSARTNLLGALKALIEKNPLIRDKLIFPTSRTSWFQSLINYCWQNDQFMNAEPNSQSETSLFTDRICSSRVHASNPLTSPAVLPVGPYTPFTHGWGTTDLPYTSPRWSPPTYTPFPTYADPSISVTANTVAPSAVLRPSTFSISPGQDTIAKRPRTLPNYQSSSYNEQQRLKCLQPIPNCKVVTLPESADPVSKVARLLYTNSGDGIVVLASNGNQELWKWRRSKQHPSGKATANVDPQHWLPKSGIRMVNDVSGVNLEEAVPCMALCNTTGNVMSAVGGRISLFNLKSLQPSRVFFPPPPASTFLALNPEDNNIVAIGMEDSTTHIYNVKAQKVITLLKGHQKRITGLTFSTNLNILVSSGADGQLCAWNTNAWEKKHSLILQQSSGTVSTSNSDTQVQFNSDQIRLLVCQERLLAIYDASKMECVQQWVPQDGLLSLISFAAYSCNSLLVYAAFCDGNIGVFDAETLRVTCHIVPSAYMTQLIPTRQPPAYPIVLATHPQAPCQLAVGLTDGSVKVLEPSESDGGWGMTSADPANNGTTYCRTAAEAATASSSATSNNPTPELQSQR